MGRKFFQYDILAKISHDFDLLTQLLSDILQECCKERVQIMSRRKFCICPTVKPICKMLGHLVECRACVKGALIFSTISQFFGKYRENTDILTVFKCTCFV